MSTYDLLIRKGLRQGIEQGIEKGIEQGIVQGIEKGAEQKSYNVVANLIQQLGFDDEAAAIMNNGHPETDGFYFY